MGSGSGCGESTGQSCLRYDNHQPNLTSFLAALLPKESFADVTLVSAEGSRVQAHKIVLSASSPYFEGVFESNPCKHPVVILKDVLLVDLQAIVNFIYNGVVSVDTARVNDLVQTAATLQIKGIKEPPKLSTEEEEEDYKPATPERRCDSSAENASPVVMQRTPSPSPSIMSYRAGRSWPTISDPPENIDDVPVRKNIGNKSASDDIPYISSTTTTCIQEDIARSECPTEHISPAGHSARTVSSSSRSGSSGKGTSSGSSSTNNQQSFVITSKKKKEVWVDPDAISTRRSYQNKKRFKQTSLFSHAMNFHKPTVDVSKTDEYNGGNRSSSHSQASSYLPNEKQKTTTTAKTGTKRKSDESVEGDDRLDTWDSQSLDTSDTFFDLSTTKDSSVYGVHSTPPTSPLQGTSKSKAKDNLKNDKTRSPLSPGKINIMEPAQSVQGKSKLSKSGSCGGQSDSTLKLFRDFDKIPECKPPSPIKPNRLQGKKKQSCAQEEELLCICKAKTDLGSIVDNKELSRRRCPIHDVDPPLLDCETPENFWCTVQYNTQELYDKGLINVASPFTPPARRRRRNSDESFADTENNSQDL